MSQGAAATALAGLRGLACALTTFAGRASFGAAGRWVMIVTVARRIPSCLAGRAADRSGIEKRRPAGLT